MRIELCLHAEDTFRVYDAAAPLRSLEIDVHDEGDGVDVTLVFADAQPTTTLEEIRKKEE